MGGGELIRGGFLIEGGAHEKFYRKEFGYSPIHCVHSFSDSWCKLNAEHTLDTSCHGVGKNTYVILSIYIFSIDVFRNVASIFIYGFFSHSILVARYIHQNKLSGITTFAV